MLFGGTQLLVASLHGPWLVNIAASLVTIVALLLLFRVWHPRRTLGPMLQDLTNSDIVLCMPKSEDVLKAILPWAILTACVGLWGMPAFIHLIDSHTAIQFPVPGLHQAVLRMPPIVTASRPEPAFFMFNWLSATGTGIFFAALIAGFVMKLSPRQILQAFLQTISKTRLTMITIATLMGFGFLTRFCDWMPCSALLSPALDSSIHFSER